MDRCWLGIISFVTNVGVIPTLIFTNIVYTFDACSLLATGIFQLIKARQFETFINWYYFTPAVILIVAGSTSIIFALIGWIATFTKREKFLCAYAILMFFTVVLEVVAAITAAVMVYYSAFDVRINLLKTINNYAKDATVQKAWDNLQQRLGCCGVVNLYDWANQPIQRGHTFSMDTKTFSIPFSCCVNFTVSKCEAMFGEGCRSVIHSELDFSVVAFGYFGLVVSMITIMLALGVLAAVPVMRNTNNEGDRREQSSSIVEAEAVVADTKVTETVVTTIPIPIPGGNHRVLIDRYNRLRLTRKDKLPRRTDAKNVLDKTNKNNCLIRTAKYTFPHLAAGDGFLDNKKINVSVHAEDERSSNSDTGLNPKDVNTVPKPTISKDFSNQTDANIPSPPKYSGNPENQPGALNLLMPAGVADPTAAVNRSDLIDKDSTSDPTSEYNFSDATVICA